MAYRFKGGLDRDRRTHFQRRDVKSEMENFRLVELKGFGGIYVPRYATKPK